MWPFGSCAICHACCGLGWKRVRAPKLEMGSSGRSTQCNAEVRTTGVCLTQQEGPEQAALATRFPERLAQAALPLLSCSAPVLLDTRVMEGEALFFSIFPQQNTSTPPTIHIPASFKAVSQTGEMYFSLLSCYGLVAQNLAGS